MNLFKSIILLVILLSAFSTQANMSMDKIILNFYSDRMSREDVTITNTGDESLYLSARVFEIKDPGSENPERVEKTDPRQAGLIVSPNRMVLAPGQSKIVRVIPTLPATDTDRVYRVLIKPHAQKMTGKSEQKTAGIKLMIGYELLAFMRPANYRVDLKAEREGKVLDLYNAGNTNINVREIKVCAKDNAECVELNGQRLYAGQSRRYELPRADGKLHIRKSVGMDFTLDEL